MSRDLATLRTVADYQFGAGAGVALFPPGDAFDVSYSSGGRPRQVHADGVHLVSYGTDGRFTLGLAGGQRLVAALAAPRARVVVGEESETFVRDGRNAFAKFVRDVDPAVRAGDEVAVVGPDGDVYGVGRAELSAVAMRDFETGMAVKVRAGAGTDAGGDGGGDASASDRGGASGGGTDTAAGDGAGAGAGGGAGAGAGDGTDGES
jgi:uncharacterized protein with predicted RNA binding PUA domain